ncbi:hypothetical protein HYFRA_00004617 [Hymenoscyphus fraxineus]|uniref:Phosphoglycerate mutase-like protein n=1 Tax=Hymenoscyphus fraxineus TaxID=746836 RepID=A0A9N9PT08_9HELO|nr:hypothetical protein HYFRA_00004617 [Hymenoscyphus fraxineus]
MQTKNLHLLALSTLAVACAAHPHPTEEYTKYSTVTGFFLQDESCTDPATFDYTAENFGLINRTYPTDGRYEEKFLTQWQRFEKYVDHLNDECDEGVEYKVLFLGRHGEGYHNVAETYYGTPAWNCYWSLLDGNGTSVWADAEITPNGVAQAQVAADYWATQVLLQKIPIPQSFYTSPLTRCLQTANITFSQLRLRHGAPFRPTVKEYFREGISGHTCDRRSSKAHIHGLFPRYKIEEGFAECDELWKPLLAEQPVNQDVRTKTVLDDVFGSDKHTWVSITSHSGEISSILRVIGHQPFRLATGAVIPVLIKAETIKGHPPPVATPVDFPDWEDWLPISPCSEPPPPPLITSISHK